MTYGIFSRRLPSPPTQPPEIKAWVKKVTSVESVAERVIEKIKEIPKIALSPENLKGSTLTKKLDKAFRDFEVKHYKHLFFWIRMQLPSPNGTFNSTVEQIKQKTSPLKFLYEFLDDLLDKKDFIDEEDYEVFSKKSDYGQVKETFKALLEKGMVNR